MEEVETKLEEVCGQFPPRRPRGIFIDGPKGTALQTGFMVAGWSSFSRGSFWREIWVTFEQVGRPVELPKRFRAKS